MHYVDQCPIYVCTLVPTHMVPDNEDNQVITELGRGLVRKEALELLAYSYTETKTGNFSISGSLELVSETFTVHVLMSAAYFA